jgi:hypothetical protein
MSVINIEEAKMQVDRKGFLDVAVDPGLDLFSEIGLRRKQHARKPASLFLPVFISWLKQLKY